MFKKMLLRAWNYISGDSRPESEEEEGEQRNFILNVINGTLTKLGDQIANPGLVLTWLMEALGVSATIIGALVPVRRSFALLPQLIVSGRMREIKVRKYFWMGGAIGFGFFIGLMVPAIALFSDFSWVGWVILGLLALASLARGVSSIAFKDVVGKTISVGRRGRLLGIRATSGGILALAAGVLMRLYLSSSTTISIFYYLLGGGALLWVLGGLVAGFIVEDNSVPDDARNPIEEIRAGSQLLQDRPDLHRFIWVRSLLNFVQLSTPYYVLFAREYISEEIGNLAVFIIMVNLSNVLSSLIWGRYADKSSRNAMIAGAGLAVLVGFLALSVDFLPHGYRNIYLLAGLILLLGIAQAGIRLGRKTYLLDIAPEGDRPLFAAVTNLIVGILTLLSGALGVIVELFNIQVLIIVVTLIPIAGIILGLSLPQVGNKAN